MLHKVSMLFLIICISIVAFVIFRTVAPDIKSETVQSSPVKALDIDMFIAHWKESAPRNEFGTLIVRDILTKCYGDPLRPTEKGAVLTDINAVRYGTIDSYTSTTPSTLNGVQYIFYIDSGKGTIESDKRTAELQEGIGVLMPPGIEFTLNNTGDNQLSMYIIEEPITYDFKPKTNMVVKNEYDNPISTNIHRVNNSRKWLFDMYDGLSTLIGINPVMWEPKSFYPPHVHSEEDEEVWIAVKGKIIVQLGKKRRAFPAGSAYKVPADGVTSHVNINDAEVSRKLIWMMKVPLREVPTLNTQKLYKDVI